MLHLGEKDDVGNLKIFLEEDKRQPYILVYFQEFDDFPVLPCVRFNEHTWIGRCLFLLCTEVYPPPGQGDDMKVHLEESLTGRHMDLVRSSVRFEGARKGRSRKQTECKALADMAASTPNVIYSGSRSPLTNKCSWCGLHEGSEEAAAAAEYPKFKHCGKCRGQLYCSKQCQAEHWKRGGHRESCVG